MSITLFSEKAIFAQVIRISELHAIQMITIDHRKEDLTVTSPDNPDRMVIAMTIRDPLETVIGRSDQIESRRSPDADFTPS